MQPAAFILRKLEWSCHTGGTRLRGAGGDKEGMAVTVSGTMAVNRGVWVGDPWCWSLCPPSWSVSRNAGVDRLCLQEPEHGPLNDTEPACVRKRSRPCK